MKSSTAVWVQMLSLPPHELYPMSNVGSCSDLSNLVKYKWLLNGIIRKEFKDPFEQSLSPSPLLNVKKLDVCLKAI